MGSKNLKAVVVRGTAGISPVDNDTYRNECLRLVKRVSNHPAALAMRELGTTNGVNIANNFGVFPTRNYKSGVYEDYKQIGPEKMHKTVYVRARACAGCPVACKRVTKLDTAQYQSLGEGPEYETLYSFGGMTGVNDIYAVTKANYLCNELGLDTISTGATIACAMEMFEEGIISQDQVGRSLTFGDADAMVDMIEKMGRREGFGDILAEGSARLAQEFGVPQYSISVKSQELAGWGTRAFKGMGLNYATGNRGACHTKANTMGVELFGKMDALATEGKPELVVNTQNAIAAFDSTGLCLFVNGMIKIKDVFTIIKASTGNEYDADSFSQAGARIWNLERLFNLKAGFTREDDTLPKRLMEEPMPEGPGKGQVVELDKMLPEYYQLRGWDTEGRPTGEKLTELGLD
jgi:aldehyde:ferredoxin oxidoreductase